MNAAFGSLGRQAMNSSGQLTPTLARELKDMKRDPLRAALLAKSGVGSGSGTTASKSRKSGGEGRDVGSEVQAPAKGADGMYSWGSRAMPWEIAVAGQSFIQQHVRMQDVLTYIR